MCGETLPHRLHWRWCTAARGPGPTRALGQRRCPARPQRPVDLAMRVEESERFQGAGTHLLRAIHSSFVDEWRSAGRDGSLVVKSRVLTTTDPAPFLRTVACAWCGHSHVAAATAFGVGAVRRRVGRRARRGRTCGLFGPARTRSDHLGGGVCAVSGCRRRTQRGASRSSRWGRKMPLPSRPASTVV